MDKRVTCRSCRIHGKTRPPCARDRARSSTVAIQSSPPIVGRRMKMFRVSAGFALVFAPLQVFAGMERPTIASSYYELNPQRFEVAVESGYLFGFINSPHSYEIGAEFLTAR